MYNSTTRKQSMSIRYVHIQNKYEVVNKFNCRRKWSKLESGFLFILIAVVRNKILVAL